MKLLKVVGVLAVAVVVGCLIARNVIAKVAIIQGVNAVTGLGVHVGRVDLGLRKTDVAVREVKVLNPKEFEDRVMVALPELYVDYDVGSLLRGHIHLEAVRVHVAELVVVRNAHGKVNVHSLRAVKEQQQAGGAVQRQPVPPQPSGLHIDLLELQVGRVIYKDYTFGATPITKAFTVNIDERYQHVTNPQALTSRILVSALAKTTIGQLANIDLAALSATAAQGILGAATGVLESTLGTQGTDTFRTLFGLGGTDKGN